MARWGRALVAAALVGPWAGCSSRMPGAREGEPARPPLGRLIERTGRALTANAVLGPLAPADVSDRRKEAYNRAAPAEWRRFAADMQLEVGLYDGLDGVCGNQWLADRGDPATRYRALAEILADDRLWVDSRSTSCTGYLAVELAALGGPAPTGADCGGRTPSYDAVDVFRSLLVSGQAAGASDGVDRDDRVHSSDEFPFLAAPP